jgi:hypothetical protein
MQLFCSRAHRGGKIQGFYLLSHPNTVILKERALCATEDPLNRVPPHPNPRK